MSYSVITKHEEINNLTKEDIFSLDKSNIYLCSKNYTPTINNKRLKTDIDFIILYMNEVNMTADAYISTYQINVTMYGDNAIDDDAIDICNYLNQ